MARSSQERFQFFSIPQDSGLVGGMNTLDLPSEIADREMVNLINFEYDAADNLVSRNGTERAMAGVAFPSRITSVFYLELSSGGVNNIVTSGSGIWEYNTSTSIKGAAVLPGDTYWQWKMFNDLAIGCNNGSVGNTNPVKWTGAGNIAQLLLTGMAGAHNNTFKYIEVWNSRLWLVCTAFPNRLYFSSLGTPEEWAVSGGFIEIGINDGDRITGIVAHREKFFIFKRRYIYVITTSISGQINTDPAGWKVDLFAQGVGCVSGYTIQSILNDVIFLSDEGVLSLQTTQQFGSFSIVALSRKLSGIKTFNRNIDTYSSCVYNFNSQYILTMTASASSVVNTIVYVLDYKKLVNGEPRWFKWQFLDYPVSCVARSFDNTTKEEQLFFGTDTPSFHLLRTRSMVSLYTDNLKAIYKEFKSKVFTLQDNFRRKEWHKIGALISFSQTNCAVSFEVRFDENDLLSRSQSFNFTTNISGARWDVENWDAGVFAGSSTNDRVILLRTPGGDVHRGFSIQYLLTNNQVNQDLIIKKLAMEVGILEIEAQEASA